MREAVERCIKAKDVNFGAYCGVSDSSQAVWDLSNAEREPGYEPQDGIR